MKPGRDISRYLALAFLACVVAIPSPGFARRGAQRHQGPPPSVAPRGQSPRQQQQAQVRQQQQGHVGDWLRRYKDVPPDEQERALQNDPAFRRLPPQRQQLLRERLQRFSSLPPEKQLQVLNRMETWEHLTPEQKRQALRIHTQMRQFPPDRQRMIRTAIQDLRAMPSEQREQVIDSPRFKGMFSDQEREVMREVTRLPLAPAEPPEGGAQPQ